MNIQVTNQTEALEAIEELKQYIKFKNVDEVEDWPKYGEYYWYLSSSAKVEEEPWFDCSEDLGRKTLGNVLRTEQEAQNHKLRLESMARRWRPGDEDTYHYIDLEDGVVMQDVWTGDDYDLSKYWIGNVHKSKSDAETWKKTYWEAFKI